MHWLILQLSTLILSSQAFAYTPLPAADVLTRTSLVLRRPGSHRGGAG